MKCGGEVEDDITFSFPQFGFWVSLYINRSCPNTIEGVGLSFLVPVCPKQDLSQVGEVYACLANNKLLKRPCPS